MNTLHSSAHEGTSHRRKVLSLQHSHKVQQVELRATCRGDKIEARFVLHENKVWNHTRGRVAAICPWVMSRQHFLVCEVTVILPQLHIPATCPCLISPECVHRKILSLLHVAATCPCKISPRVQPP